MTYRIRISMIGGRILEPSLIAEVEGSESDAERLRTFLNGSSVMKSDGITPTDMTWLIEAKASEPAIWLPVEFDSHGRVVRQKGGELNG